MLTLKMNQFKHWLQNHPNPNYRRLFIHLKAVRSFELPTPKAFNKTMYYCHQLVTSLWNSTTRLLVHTPAFKGRLNQYGKNVYIYGGVPLVTGPLTINLGSDCRISGQTTFSGRSASLSPILEIGNNVGIGWQTTIAVGRKVIIEDNVRIAGKAFLFGYSGHPLDAKKRALGLPDEESQVGDIILRKDVWLGSNVTVKGGVTIGEGTIIAAGSVVTRSLPSFVIAAGNPAKVVRSLESTTTLLKAQA
ncbi:acyltransferase [Vibrio tapetis subsp. quintayensis]|uniref:acyltransferase n=1 Tax=Vibrio tapetis TaxID=52443 RepID=UPI0025B43FA8|nr:acyltransferase [Vibrio tapetis]MDN3680258.1 acyltransferase [Vibrio tapetis subsp. quintayensis]